MYLHTGDRFAAAQSAWLLASFYDELSTMDGEDADGDFIDCLIEMIVDRDVPNLERLRAYYETLDSEEMPIDTEENVPDASTSHPAVEVTKQSRNRDKKKKDDKRREYAKHSYGPGAPRTKGSAGCVLPARRSPEKKFFKKKVNRTVRRYKGYLPKGNGYRKMDPDLWMWW